MEGAFVFLPADIPVCTDIYRILHPRKRIEFVVGLLADKDVQSILKLLEEVGDAFYFADIQNERAMKASVIYELSQAENKYIINDALTLLSEPVKADTVRIVTGSLYLLSEIRQEFKNII